MHTPKALLPTAAALSFALVSLGAFDRAPDGRVRVVLTPSAHALFIRIRLPRVFQRIVNDVANGVKQAARTVADTAKRVGNGFVQTVKNVGKGISDTVK